MLRPAVVVVTLAAVCLQANANYVSKASRGSQTVRFDFGEECVLPKHFPGASYREKDFEKESELCTFDFYIKTSTETRKSVALCPKVESTNPAVELFLFAPDQSKDAFEQIECPKRDNDRGGKKLAKYKQSLTCSYTPSILGYYHLSRILGDVGDVPISVVRTMDKERHREFVTKAGEIVAKIYPNKDPIIESSWRMTWPALHGNPGGEKGQRVFSQDHRYVFGALSQNVKKEIKYRELFPKTYETRYADFKAKPAYKNLLNPKPVTQWFSATDVNARFMQAAQTVVQMRDIVDATVMDHILAQADRIGNMHFTYQYLTLENGKITSQLAKLIDDPNGGDDLPDPAQVKAMGAKGSPLVKVMMIRDNDCGVIKSNEARRHELLKGIRHISPSTYQRVQWLNGMIRSKQGEADLRTFFQDEALFTDKDWLATKGFINEVATSLKTACKAGELHLDLDLKAVATGEAPVDSRALCE